MKSFRTLSRKTYLGFDLKFLHFNVFNVSYPVISTEPTTVTLTTFVSTTMANTTVVPGMNSTMNLGLIRIQYMYSIDNLVKIQI